MASSARIYVAASDYGSVTFGITGLDVSYTDGNRLVIWYRSETGEEGTFTKMDGWTTIYPREATAREQMTVPGLFEAEEVYVTCDILFKNGDTVRLDPCKGKAESIIVDGKYPKIVDFTAAYDDGILTARIKIRNLVANSSVNMVLRRSSKLVGSYTFYAGEDYVMASVVEIVKTVRISQPGMYRFRAYAENVIDDEGYESGFVTCACKVTEGEAVPLAFLPVTFRDTRYSYDNARVTGTVSAYPLISADDLNDLWADVNVMREKAGLAAVPVDVIASYDAMTAEVFGSLIAAAKEAADKSGAAWITPAPATGYTIQAAFFDGLNADLQNLKTTLYGGTV